MPSWICKIPFLNRYLHKFPNFRSISLVSFSTSIPKISIFDYLVNQHNFSPECASKVSSSLSTNFINKPQNADLVLNFFKEIGFAKNQIEVVVKRVPRLLSCKLETSIKPKIKVFQDLGYHSTDLAYIFSTSPWLLNTSADRLQLSVVTVKKILGPDVDICRLLRNYGFWEVLTHDSFVPNIEYLKGCGICSLKIATCVCRCPLTFIFNQEKFKSIVERVEEMGVDRKSKNFLEAVRVMSCMSRENWEHKLKLFRDLGFSENDILFAFRRMPPAFNSSESKIKEVMPLLLSVEDISYIARNPTMLSYSVEKRLKPRLRVLKALLDKNLLEKKPFLAGFLKIPDAKFINKYVSPYSNEVAALYIAGQGS